jgi:hypothetical protein
MRPLRLVPPTDLIPGKTYLIREKRPEYAHLNTKGVFVKNEYPPSSHYCTISHFTNTHIANNAHYIDLRLQDAYWNYYEADAVERAYITKALRVITGDPDFIFDNY